MLNSWLLKEFKSFCEESNLPIYKADEDIIDNANENIIDWFITFLTEDRRTRVYSHIEVTKWIHTKAYTNKILSKDFVDIDIIEYDPGADLLWDGCQGFRYAIELRYIRVSDIIELPQKLFDFYEAIKFAEEIIEQRSEENTYYYAGVVILFINLEGLVFNPDEQFDDILNEVAGDIHQNDQHLHFNGRYKIQRLQFQENIMVCIVNV